MNYPNQFQLTLEQNIFLAKKRLVSQIYHISRFENCKTTLLQTEKIIHNQNDNGVSIDDIGVIVCLKRGFEYVFEHLRTACTIDLSLMQKINGIVAVHDALDAGNFRTGRVGVTLYDGNRHEPLPVNPSDIQDFLQTVLAKNISTTEKALTIMLYMMRNQLFWDGNKRTAILFANAIMIANGCGVIEIDETHFDEFNLKLSDFYQSNDMTKIMAFVYQNCIQGIEF